jgi:hypothetical protein
MAGLPSTGHLASQMPQQMQSSRSTRGCWRVWTIPLRSRTSTLALTNATLPYVRVIAAQGVENAVQQDPIIRSALNTYQGTIVNKILAESLGFTTR